MTVLLYIESASVYVYHGKMRREGMWRVRLPLPIRVPHTLRPTVLWMRGCAGGMMKSGTRLSLFLRMLTWNRVWTRTEAPKEVKKENLGRTPFRKGPPISAALKSGLPERIKAPRAAVHLRGHMVASTYDERENRPQRLCKSS